MMQCINITESIPMLLQIMLLFERVLIERRRYYVIYFVGYGMKMGNMKSGKELLTTIIGKCI